MEIGIGYHTQNLTYDRVGKMFYIRRMGCDYHHEEDFRIERENGYDCFLALFIKSPCLLKKEGQIISCKPHTFILFNINSSHFYAADGEEYIDDWIQFECNSNLLARMNVAFDQPIYIGEYTHLDYYFQLICNAYFRGHNDDEVIDHLMKGLFAEISSQTSSDILSIPHYNELVNLRRKIFEFPQKDWSIEKIAKEFYISEPYFQELYKRAFHITCIADVINCRISYAKSLLSNPGISIEEVGYQCGYKSQVHFSRQFKKITGLSPSEWRKNK